LKIINVKVFPSESVEISKRDYFSIFAKGGNVMKAFIKAVTLIGVIAAYQVGFALAEEVRWISGGDQSTTLVGEEKVTTTEQAPCTTCGGCQESCGCPCDPGCEACPRWGIIGFAGLDSFKGISDGSSESNFGAVTGLNAAIPITGPDSYGLSWQLGMSYGVYDFDGWGNEFNVRRRSAQQQTFLTTGFFHKANSDQRLSYGIVYDWMFNDNWGEYVGNDPTLGQWRGQVEYATSCCNAFGIWGTVRDRNSRQVLDQFPVTNRPISQVNFFWHHKFCTGADSYLWVGVPQNDRLRGVFNNGGHSLGNWMVGANVQAPLSESLALYANGSYFHPSAAAGAIAAMESGYDVSIGVLWYFGRNAISHSLNGKCGLPYMPVGNNSNFLVDQSDNY
jgi:hypothetical protein